MRVGSMYVYIRQEGKSKNLCRRKCVRRVIFWNCTELLGALPFLRGVWHLMTGILPISINGDWDLGPTGDHTITDIKGVKSDSYYALTGSHDLIYSVHYQRKSHSQLTEWARWFEYTFPLVVNGVNCCSTIILLGYGLFFRILTGFIKSCFIYVWQWDNVCSIASYWKNIASGASKDYFMCHLTLSPQLKKLTFLIFRFVDLYTY